MIIEKSQVQLNQLIENTFREEAGRVLATLIAQLGDFELAEDVLQEAFIMALEHWPKEGVPHKPAAWLLTIARRKAIDRLRRVKNLARKQLLLQNLVEIQPMGQNDPAFIVEASQIEVFPDERLKLIFTCCHPALKMDTQVALTLHTLGGLTTAEIARAFLVPEPTMAQRLVRAKRKICEAGIPYAVPTADRLGERLDGVLAVLYLIFNAGYTASLGDSLIRHDLCAEAIRLGRALVSLLEEEPSLRKEPEALGLLALMLLHDARREARLGPTGDMITLEEQDRSRWHHRQIAEGSAILDRALLVREPGSYQIQAAISALHSQAMRAEETDWFQIAMLYGELIKYNRSAVVRLNWAVAVAMATTPARGLVILAELENNPDLKDYYLFHAARADLLRRAEEWRAAQTAYQQALIFTHNSVEQAFLQRRLREVQSHLTY